MKMHKHLALPEHGSGTPDPAHTMPTERSRNGFMAFSEKKKLKLDLIISNLIYLGLLLIKNL